MLKRRSQIPISRIPWRWQKKCGSKSTDNYTSDSTSIYSGYPNPNLHTCQSMSARICRHQYCESRSLQYPPVQNALYYNSIHLRARNFMSSLLLSNLKHSNHQICPALGRNLVTEKEGENRMQGYLVPSRLVLVSLRLHFSSSLFFLSCSQSHHVLVVMM